jgi:hypothetical protein
MFAAETMGRIHSVHPIHSLFKSFPTYTIHTSETANYFAVHVIVCFSTLQTCFSVARSQQSEQH